jgi:general secretion pathway protein J
VNVKPHDARRSARSRGLTLLEVLVSISILALITTLVYGAFDGMTRARQGLTRIDDRYHQGRNALARMTREIQSAFLSLHMPGGGVPGVSVSPLLTRTTVFIGTDSSTSDRVDFCSFSHRRISRNTHESDQNELSYFLARDPNDNSKYDLVRREQREIDLEPTRGGVVNVLAENATALNFQYLDPLTGLWQESWDSTQAAGQYNRLPLQVRIQLALNGGIGDRPIKLETKVALGMQTAVGFAIPRQQR